MTVLLPRGFILLRRTSNRARLQTKFIKVEQHTTASPRLQFQCRYKPSLTVWTNAQHLGQAIGANSMVAQTLKTSAGRPARTTAEQTLNTARFAQAANWIVERAPSTSVGPCARRDTQRLGQAMGANSTVEKPPKRTPLPHLRPPAAHAPPPACHSTRPHACMCARDAHPRRSSTANSMRDPCRCHTRDDANNSPCAQ